ncbi:Phytanoyl-CoA dioxygenase [Sphingobium herbicidovorans NBRC 16415]|uniref:Phytanoyl-CoA dioxygenase n=1 Tax=Sphingobium herbicidovorans (strain ATCC 700291 / DSM 11019 / CCUG 56400 / KCTC 2939 / LMG 18315 / NBRC 16415 / MH) TaxID=1219045 RepID=A0A086P4K4_SPHHM|nr:phytanoyl-CoA dioxygenase family protein [Sphingobium herbicidovorans]KFG88322.1 Phytanoyl-CoA dioxygenase [Sphingobium herbicidovorans NBRC 16415]
MAVGNAKKQVIQNMGGEDTRPVKPLEFDGPLPRPTTDRDQIRADLDRAGYAIAADVFTRDKAREMRDFLAAEIARDEAIDEERVRRFYTDTDDLNRRMSGTELVNRHPFFRDILEHELPLQITRELLGPQTLNESYLVHSYGANVTRPGSAQQAIHRDRSGAVPLSAGAAQTRFIWCLDDFVEENGATRVVPGSHRDTEPQSWTVQYESVPAEAPAGSVLIYTDLLLHGTGPNTSSNLERAGVIVGYCPPWWKPMINFPMTTNPAVLKDSSKVLRQLLGYSSVSVGFEEAWTYAPQAVKDLIVLPEMEW